MPLKYSQGLYDPTPVQAIYTPQVLPIFQGNPFIEAMENLLELEEIMDITGSYPPYSEDLCLIEDRYQRMSYVSTLLGSFREPLSTDITLYLQLHTVACKGYVRNNPLLRGYWDEVDPDLLEFYGITPSGTKVLQFLPPVAYGFTVPGESGTGKSSTMEQIARIFRAMIMHGLYEGKILEVLRQIPVVIVTCPEGAALRIFCEEFFHAVDAIADTGYFKRYVKSGVNNTELKRKVAIVCRLHGIGVIVLDEAQNLADAKRGFEKELLAFLTTFHTKVKVPLVLVGTPAFEDIWKESFSAGRRFLGESPVEFSRFPLDLSRDSKLRAFCTGMWPYQLTRKKIPMTDEILEELHVLTQGNPDLMKKAYQFVQVLAIQWGKDDEVIGPANFRKIRGKFGPVEEALQALRDSDYKLVAEKFKDLRPPENKKRRKKAKKTDQTQDNQAANNNGTMPATDSASSSGDAGGAKTENASGTPIPNPLKGKSDRAQKRLESEPKHRLTGQEKNELADRNYEDLKNQGLIGFAPPDV